MANENGEWIMRGLSWNDPYRIRSWRELVNCCRGAEVLEASEMESNEEVWADWLKQDNEYAVGDRRAMEAGGGRYLNFIKLVLRKN